MQLLDNATAVATKPSPKSNSSTGWFTDGDPKSNVAPSMPDATWSNHVTAELQNLVLHGKPSSLQHSDDAQLVTSVGGAVALESDGSDTGTTSTHHDRLLAAAKSSRANQPRTAVIGAEDSLAQATTGSAVVAASKGATAEGSRSFLAACLTSNGNGGPIVQTEEGAMLSSEDCYVSGKRSLLVASRNAQLNDPDTIGGGDNSAVSAITDQNANQGLKWRIDSKTGRAFFEDVHSGKLNLDSLPQGTSQPGGLSTGDVWVDTSNNDNILRIVL